MEVLAGTVVGIVVVVAGVGIACVGLAGSSRPVAGEGSLVVDRTPVEGTGEHRLGSSLG